MEKGQDPDLEIRKNRPRARGPEILAEHGGLRLYHRSLIILWSPQKDDVGMVQNHEGGALNDRRISKDEVDVYHAHAYFHFNSMMSMNSGPSTWFLGSRPIRSPSPLQNARSGDTVSAAAGVGVQQSITAPREPIKHRILPDD